MRGNIYLVCAQPTLDCYFLESVVGELKAIEPDFKGNK